MSRHRRHARRASVGGDDHPDGRWVEVADAGHAVNQDNLAGFLAALRPFLLGEAG